jgi:hypothetical protein
MAGKESIQLASERLAILCGVRRRAAGIDAGTAELLHHLTHRQALLDILRAKERLI